jgi:hypothetical protein
MAWVFREQSVERLRIDAHIEVVHGDAVLGLFLALGIKGAERWFSEPEPGQMTT